MVLETASSKQPGTAKRLKEFSGRVRDEWTFTSAVTDEYYDFLQEVDCLQILTKTEAKSKLKTKRVLDGEYFWAVQGIDPATNEPGQLQVKTGGSPKYLTPTGGGSDAVFLPLLNNEPWVEAIDRLGVTGFTEGAKKAALVYSLTGIPTVSITGVDSWAPSTKDGKLRSNLDWYWKKVLERKATVLIFFDMDFHEKPGVLRNLLGIKRFCEESGIPYRIMSWNKDYKGIDDYTASIGQGKTGEELEKEQQEALRAVLESNFDISQWEKQFKPSDDVADDAESIADALIDEFRQNYKFHREHKTWRMWNGKFWEALDSDLMNSIVQSSGKTHGFRFKKYATLKDVISFLRTGGLAQREWIEQQREKFINFKNGTYDIETGELLPHQPGYNFISCLERNYKQVIAEKDDKIEELLGKYCPVFFYTYMEQFNDDLTKVLKLVAIVQALLTYQCYDLQFFLHLQGKPGSGKGTFSRLLTEIVGSTNTVSLSLKDLNSDYHKARAIPSQLVLCSDEDKQNGEYKGLKAITGGDLISFRPIYGEPGEDYFRGLLVVTSNNPIFAGDTTGLDRRICLVKFDKSFEKLNNFSERAMREEIDNLISIALMMSKEQVRSLLKEETGSSTKYDRWLHKMELCSVASYMEQILAPASMECMEQISNHENSLYAQYRKYCSENGQNAANSQTFSRRLGEHLDFLGWKYDKESKARIYDSPYPVRVIKGIASKITHSGFESEPTIAERLNQYNYSPVSTAAVAVADGFGGVADICADDCADEKPFKNKGCADVADDFPKTPTVFESAALHCTNNLEDGQSSEISSATQAQSLQGENFPSAQTQAQPSAQVKATSATGIQIGSTVGKQKDGRKLTGWVGTVRTMSESDSNGCWVWWHGDYDKTKSGKVIKNPDGTQREKLTYEEISNLILKDS